MPGSPLSSEELRLAKLWYNEDNVAPSEIARRLRRVKSTITRAVVQELPRGGRGRKRVLSDAEVGATIMGGRRPQLFIFKFHGSDCVETVLSHNDRAFLI